MSEPEYDKLRLVSAPAKNRYDLLLIVVSVAVVAWMAVACLLLFLWKTQPVLVTTGAGVRVAVAACPPFMLVPVIAQSEDSALANVIVGGTVVVGNAALYAGLAAFAYWVLITLTPKRNH